MTLTGHELSKRFFLSWIEPHISDPELEMRLSKNLSIAPYLGGIAVNNHQIPLAKKILQAADMMVLGTVAYPLGGLPIELKCASIQELSDLGADQIDIVMEIESILAWDEKPIMDEIDAIMKIETEARLCLIPNLDWLDSSSQIRLGELIAQTQRLILRTTTGYGLSTSLATIQNLRSSVGAELEILVSGGCETPVQALDFIAAGADGLYVKDVDSFIHQYETLARFQTTKEEK